MVCRKVNTAASLKALRTAASWYSGFRHSARASLQKPAPMNSSCPRRSIISNRHVKMYRSQYTIMDICVVFSCCFVVIDWLLFLFNIMYVSLCAFVYNGMETQQVDVQYKAGVSHMTMLKTIFRASPHEFGAQPFPT